MKAKAVVVGTVPCAFRAAFSRARCGLASLINSHLFPLNAGWDGAARASVLVISLQVKSGHVFFTGSFDATCTRSAQGSLS